MDYNVTRVFRKETEADAFANGIEYVNESSIQVVAKKRVRGRWVVFIQDDDAPPRE